MNYILENEEWVMQVQDRGAELNSVRCKATGKEYIWQADPDIWARHAPVLFPIVGRLRKDQYRIGEQVFTMRQHGFARDRDFKMLEQVPNRLRFGLTADQQTMELYPFNFILDIEYYLQDNKLSVTYSVTNQDQRPMPFSIGAHPAFNIPRVVKQQVQEYHLLFEKAELLARYLLTDGLQNGQQERLMHHDQLLPLHPALFEQDAIIFKHPKSENVSLINQSTGQKIVELKMRGFPYLGIWQKSGAEFICIEPWYGLADSTDFGSELIHKEGIQVIDPEEVFCCSYTLVFFNDN